VNPEGMVDFKGFSTEIMFFKGALEKLDIEAQVIKVGTYKSAVEPYILDKMSKPNREQITSFLGSLYTHFLSNIAISRKIPVDSLSAIANTAAVQTATDAVKFRLVDGVKYKDEVLTELKSLCGIAQKKELRSVSISDYTPQSKELSKASADRIAVVYAVGEIVSGVGKVDGHQDEIFNSDGALALVKHLAILNLGGSSSDCNTWYKSNEFILEELKKNFPSSYHILTTINFSSKESTDSS
jgi:ClpP class serine protease